MSLIASHDTLAYQIGARPLTVVRDLGSSSMVDWAAQAKEARANLKGDPSPELEAVKFYLVQHVLGEVVRRYDKHEPLDPGAASAVNSFHEIGSASALRMFHYLCYITIREIRHMSLGSSGAEKMRKQFGNEATDHVISLKGGSEEAGYSKTMNNPPACTVAQFFGAIEWGFFHGSFSGGFGGKPWGKITTCLARVLRGEASLENMVDTAFTLAHNNGPIFNKGLFFGGYTHELGRILDVQRSGQIPEYIAGTGNTHGTIGMGLVLETVKKWLPWVRFGEYVDWYKVTALGAVNGHYEAEKKLQAKTYGLATPYAKKLGGPEATEIEKTVKMAKENKAGFYEMAPGVYVKKFVRTEDGKYVPAAAMAA